MKPKSKKPAARGAKSKTTSGRSTKPKKTAARATKKKAGPAPEEVMTSMAKLLASYQEADDNNQAPRGCCKVPNGPYKICIPNMLEADCLSIAGAIWTPGPCPNPCDSGGSG